MRSLLVLIMSMLLPSRGRHAAADTPEPASPAPTPTAVRPAARRQVLRGEDVQLVRPYLLAHERKLEREAQRERRTAAALASMGVDYVPAGRAA